MNDAIDRLRTALANQYTIERELGGGGMAQVYLAEERRLGRKVVVKVLPPTLAAEISASRFEREMEFAARLQHPQIVPLLTAGDADGVPFYTMPFIDGDSLATRIARGPLAARETIDILRDVGKALVRPRAGCGAPRHQAGQRPADGRLRDRHRFRDREGGGGRGNPRASTFRARRCARRP